jgi:pilus assembly protein CpaC
MKRMQMVNPWAVLVTCLVALLPAWLPAQPSPNGTTTRPPEQRLQLSVRQSQVIDAPWPVKRVAVTDPSIADVQVLTPQRVLVQAKAAGSTDLLLWSETEDVWRARVDVEVDTDLISSELERLFPDAGLEVRKSQDLVIVSGKLARAEDVAALRRFLTATGAKFVDMTNLAGLQQVLLKVRIAEVSRSAIRALGFNMFGTGTDFFGGISIGAAGSPLNPVSIGPAAGTVVNRTIPFTFNADVNISPAVTLFAGIPDANLEFFLQALAENQYLRILAEPNLVALSGEQASFLAGGEFPIPIVQGGILAAASVTIEYKQFGVQLRFRPTVMGDGSIRLHVAPEVSQLSDQGAVVIQGFRIPSLVTRRAETTLELKSGQTFGMAGLIQRQSLARSSRVPGAGDIPILGALFRSVRYQEDETELVVLVTASLVEPLSTAEMPVAPGMNHVTPNDWELYGLGKVEGQGSGTVAPADAEWMRNLGLENLRGPGAWTTYEQPSAPAPSEPGTVPEPSAMVPAETVETAPAVMAQAAAAPVAGPADEQPALAAPPAPEESTAAATPAAELE